MQSLKYYWLFFAYLTLALLGSTSCSVSAEELRPLLLENVEDAEVFSNHGILEPALDRLNAFHLSVRDGDAIYYQGVGSRWGHWLVVQKSMRDSLRLVECWGILLGNGKPIGVRLDTANLLMLKRLLASTSKAELSVLSFGDLSKTNDDELTSLLDTILDSCADTLVIYATVPEFERVGALEVGKQLLARAKVLTLYSNSILVYPDALKHCKDLRTLELGCSVAHDLSWLSRLPSVEELCVVVYNDDDLKLPALPNLKRLNIGGIGVMALGAKSLDTNKLADILPDAPSLVALDITIRGHLRSSAFIRKYPRLEHLSIDCEYISDGFNVSDVPAGLKSMKLRVTILNMSGFAAKLFGRKLTSVEDLDLELPMDKFDCSWIKEYRKLKRLRIWSFTDMSNASELGGASELSQLDFGVIARDDKQLEDLVREISLLDRLRILKYNGMALSGTAMATLLANTHAGYLDVRRIGSDTCDYSGFTNKHVTRLRLESSTTLCSEKMGWLNCFTQLRAAELACTSRTIASLVRNSLNLSQLKLSWWGVSGDAPTSDDMSLIHLDGLSFESLDIDYAPLQMIESVNVNQFLKGIRCANLSFRLYGEFAGYSFLSAFRGVKVCELCVGQGRDSLIGVESLSQVEVLQVVGSDGSDLQVLELLPRNCMISVRMKAGAPVRAIEELGQKRPDLLVFSYR